MLEKQQPLLLSFTAKLGKRVTLIKAVNMRGQTDWTDAISSKRCIGCILTPIARVPIKGWPFIIRKRAPVPILHLDRKRTILFSTRPEEGHTRVVIAWKTTRKNASESNQGKWEETWPHLGIIRFRLKERDKIELGCILGNYHKELLVCCYKTHFSSPNKWHGQATALLR